MLTFAEIEPQVRETGLAVVGAFHPEPADGVPDTPGTVILLGPGGPEMWDAFQRAAEARDGVAHPLDRWSRRVITALAVACGAETLFPFGGPPWHPFQRWAARGEGAVTSPVAMQVTAGRGLWTSYRGALSFAAQIDLPVHDRHAPCIDCPAPCQSACPVDAFDTGSYDVPACVSHMKSTAGAACHAGCLVRRACPAGRAVGLPERQRAFHMAAFLRANG